MSLIEPDELDRIRKESAAARRMIVAVVDGLSSLLGRLDTLDRLARVIEFRMILQEDVEEDDNGIFIES